MRALFVVAPTSIALLGSVLSTRAATVLPPPPNVTRLGIYTPWPEYPPDALKRHIRGHGVFLLRVQIPSGHVTQVIVGLSTGSRVLDAATIKVLQQWRFKPGAVPYLKITSVRMSPPQTKEETLVKVPVTFT